MSFHAVRLSDFVNDAHIGGADSPHVVIEKLQIAIDRALKVLVPMEPTDAMCQAGQDVCSYAEHDAGQVYRAMLSASGAKR